MSIKLDNARLCRDGYKAYVQFTIPNNYLIKKRKIEWINRLIT
jgi:hypothetical protein